MVPVTKAADSPVASLFRTLWEDLVCEGCVRDVCRESVPFLDVRDKAARQDGFTQRSKHTAAGEEWSAWPPSVVSTRR